MHKHAAATALVIVLNITMLTPAVSAGGWWRFLPVRNEEACDSSVSPDFPNYRVNCHCRFECYRKHSYTVRMRNPGQPGWPGDLCNFIVHRAETAHACLNTCLKAKGAPLPRP
jgi:hypothetical protein